MKRTEDQMYSDTACILTQGIVREIDTKDDRITMLETALKGFAYQAETVASLQTCGESTFLRGLAKAMRKVLE